MEQSLKEKLIKMGELSKKAKKDFVKLSTKDKNKILENIKISLEENRQNILAANKKDYDKGLSNNMAEGLLDRLKLDDDRIDSMILSIDQMIKLPDPIGKMTDVRTLENGLLLGKKSVAIGSLAMIYEARPNVTLDASILAIKSSNTIILRSGKEAINSSLAIAKAIREGIKNTGFDENIVQIIDDTSRDSSTGLMQLNGYVDLLIPRGSASLINAVVKNASVPTLETGVGNCHLYVDKYADIEKALKIFENGKTQRIGVCNALESLVVHKDIDQSFYDGLNKIVEKYKLKVHACKNSIEKIKGAMPASDEDYGKEYLDYEFSVKEVQNIDEAIDHIYKYSTGHSDAIITEKIDKANKFVNQVDSACVYVNASTRFTDGSEFGFGAEIGISTQRLHARGPVGLNELTTYKYVILGEGQIRE
ncbi:glutamate-5-semialdehyde dehydrogenase [Anaerococcus hydrogenalis]|uniref:Gamma-glutamyl phosphate reductase n=2 Tax=Anaerococcus hydrogenalis TaxID=33029 RepID=F0H0L0_9FIRM|nr:glutamate-5-semialdehyde dehydrogenase [Anaerococcus hydrogenalis]EGC83995.1 glutamate-5-semialdehyde dehydrogenase [Anaerococcus hydrogenalis ACS-025-V-Sch4]MDK7695695.1 glutamate-5-semialdehyde dehydrogenase [Anaerococcus hydrogenalis]MDK7697482.1 glutamate-5-semialdehyde dehydrogenase [Anaerococcus hydrogenalis]MDK7708749.1 glutamate-5-semialdehyde dehydrogenase [Anaerococcus hydrogenalis]PMC80816.1 glutamate-5-semialdehyde dehydrogenase [Anaerococcus hydrogenalis]